LSAKKAFFFLFFLSGGTGVFHSSVPQGSVALQRGIPPQIFSARRWPLRPMGVETDRPPLLKIAFSPPLTLSPPFSLSRNGRTSLPRPRVWRELGDFGKDRMSPHCRRPRFLFVEVRTPPLWCNEILSLLEFPDGCHPALGFSLNSFLRRFPASSSREASSSAKCSGFPRRSRLLSSSRTGFFFPGSLGCFDHRGQVSVTRLHQTYAFIAPPFSELGLKLGRRFYPFNKPPLDLGLG